MRPDICEQACNACGECVETCVEGVLDIVGGVARTVQEDACTGCEACVDHCPTAAICIDDGWPIAAGSGASRATPAC